MRWLAIDPGDRYIGVAVSDPLGLIARPLTTLEHVARAADAERLIALAREHAVESVIVGWPLDEDGQAGPQARKSERLAEALRALTDLPVLLVDESGSSQTARALLIATGKSRRARHAQEHAAAAAALLQSYLDANSSEPPPR
ncbi:MAG: Holliday junction resolvase RuvX [Anaerolineales bacterium]|nr:Holliday junction resolvase RuvX [Anaerolineales bacterium]